MRTWYPIFEFRCPKCGGHIIINKRYIECSELRCDYVHGPGFGNK